MGSVNGNGHDGAHELNPRAVRQSAFLKAFEHLANISRAAKAVGIVRETHYLWLQEDPTYKPRWEIAVRASGSALEEEAFRRAYDGVVEPVFRNGKRAIDIELDRDGNIVYDEQGRPKPIPAFIRVYSDRMLELLLTGLMREKYGRNVNLSGGIGVGVADLTDVRKKLMDALTDLPTEVRAQIAQKLLGADTEPST